MTDRSIVVFTSGAVGEPNATRTLTPIDDERTRVVTDTLSPAKLQTALETVHRAGMPGVVRRGA
ncbi:hypothetical protein ACFQZZ_01590 [Nocardia sp. GCM10030253]|uniref:hypothetical protein n=1 Tax=Nocardia sp. GCM10030253 TaxID=3273404 RepID=UPI003627EAC1